jgi:hypothetical protein
VHSHKEPIGQQPQSGLTVGLEPRVPNSIAGVRTNVFQQLTRLGVARTLYRKHASKWAFALCPMPGFGMEHVHVTNTVMMRLSWLAYNAGARGAVKKKGASQPARMNKTQFEGWVKDNSKGWDLWFDLAKIEQLVSRNRHLSFSGCITTDGVTACVHFDRQVCTVPTRGSCTKEGQQTG